MAHHPGGSCTAPACHCQHKSPHPTIAGKCVCGHELTAHRGSSLSILGKLKAAAVGGRPRRLSFGEEDPVAPGIEILEEAKDRSPFSSPPSSPPLQAVSPKSSAPAPRMQDLRLDVSPPPGAAPRSPAVSPTAAPAAPSPKTLHGSSPQQKPQPTPVNQSATFLSPTSIGLGLQLRNPPPPSPVVAPLATVSAVASPSSVSGARSTPDSGWGGYKVSQVIELAKGEEGLGTLLMREVDFTITELKEIGFSGPSAARIVTWIKQRKAGVLESPRPSAPTPSELWSELPGVNTPPYRCSLADLASRLSGVWSMPENVAFMIAMEFITPCPKTVGMVDRQKFDNFVATFGLTLPEIARIMHRDFFDSESKDFMHSFHAYVMETDALKRIPDPGGYLYRYGNSRPGTLCLTRASKRLSATGQKQVTSHCLSLKNGAWHELGGESYPTLAAFEYALRDKLVSLVRYQLQIVGEEGSGSTVDGGPKAGLYFTEKGVYGQVGSYIMQGGGLEEQSVGPEVAVLDRMTSFPS